MGLSTHAFAQPKPVTAPADKPAAPAKPAPAPAKAAGPAKPAAAAPAKPGAKPAKQPTARELFASGEKKFKDGDYAGALADFQAVDAIKSTPQSQRYIGLCHDNLGHFRDAASAYEKFLADVPPKMTAQGDEVKKRVEAIKAMPGKVALTSVPEGAAVMVDDKAHPNPTPTELELVPGKHVLKFTAEGRDPAEKEVEVAFASKQDVNVELPAKPEPPPPPPVAAAPPEPAPPPPPPKEPPSKVPAFVTGGIAIVAAGVGTAFGLMALSAKDDFDENPTADKADDGENKALISDMAFGVALTFGVTSAVLFLTNDPSPTGAAAKKAPPKAVRLTPTPIISPNGGGMGAVLRF